MRILLSADWQIGARFRQFGEKGAFLRAARVRTLAKALALAAARKVDAFVIAGDLFEDHQIDHAAIQEVFDVLAGRAEIPIFIVPGNHDPAGVAGGIWGRKPFLNAPRHVTVFSQPSVVELAGGWMLVNPLTQKKSTVDPTLKLAAMARDVPADAVKIGITHGSPAIASMHMPDDFPIGLEAASSSGLDFLGLGHWHSTLSLDSGRILMSGTPEPTDYAEHSAGLVHEVEVTSAGAVPRVTAHRCAELQWRQFAFEVGADAEATQSALESTLATEAAEPARTVCRVVLSGMASPPHAQEMLAWLRARLSAYAVCDLRDTTTPEFTGQELEELGREHPMLLGVLEDLGALESPGGSFAREDLLELASRVRCEPGDLSPELARSARRLFMAVVREAQSAC